MALTTEEVRYIAALARLQFTPEEEAQLAEQMSAILEYMDKLNEADTEGIEPMSHVLDLYNVERPDVVMARVDREAALAVAPDADGTYFRVPRVIE